MFRQKKIPKENKNKTIQYTSPSSLIIWLRTLDYYNKGRQKNNSSRDEIHENSRIHLNYKTNAQIAKELKITPISDKLLENKRSWMQPVKRMSRNRLSRVMKHYSPTGRRNHGRPLKRLLDT